jgi:hypothetical protein
MGKRGRTQGKQKNGVKRIAKRIRKTLDFRKAYVKMRSITFLRTLNFDFVLTTFLVYVLRTT